MFHTTFKVQFLTLAELGSDCDLFERSRPLNTYSHQELHVALKTFLLANDKVIDAVCLGSRGTSLVMVGCSVYLLEFLTPI